MRIWSFQNKDSLSVFHDSRWNRFSFQEHNTKPEDMKFSQHVNVRDAHYSMVQVERLPVYGYAKMMSDFTGGLNLRVYLQQYDYLFNIYGQEILNKVMYELDVPDDSILIIRSLKDENKLSYTPCMKMIRDSDNDDVYEVLIPELRLEWIAAYHQFSAMHQHDGMISTATIVDSKLSPMYIGSVYITSDKKVYYNDDVGNIVSSNAFNIDSLVGSIGPDNCPEYFTVSEALNYCNSEYKKYLVKICKKFGIFESKYNSVTIKDLSNRNKTSSNIAELFSIAEGNK